MHSIRNVTIMSEGVGRSQPSEMGPYYFLILTSYSGFPAKLKKTLNTKFASYETDKHKYGDVILKCVLNEPTHPTNLFF